MLCEEHSIHTRKIAETEQSVKSAHIRIDEMKKKIEKIESSQELLFEMNTNIKIITQEQIHQNDKIGCISNDLKELREKPMREWSKIKTAIVTAVLTTIAVATLTNFDAFLQIFN